MISETFENGANLDAPYRFDTYGYDLTGNRLQHESLVDNTSDGIVDGNDAVSLTTYQYDANDRLEVEHKDTDGDAGGPG